MKETGIELVGAMNRALHGPIESPEDFIIAYNKYRDGIIQGKLEVSPLNQSYVLVLLSIAQKRGWLKIVKEAV